MSRTRITTEDLDQLLRLRRTKTIRQTARLLDMSPTTVGEYCDQLLANVLRRWTPPNERRRGRSREEQPSEHPRDESMPRGHSSR
jgi:hypothetical protein